MPTSDIKLFGAALDSAFTKPIPFAAPMLDSVVDALGQAVGFRISSDQVRVRISDALYNYDLHASFFGGSGTFARNADRMSIALNNGVGTEDIKLISSILGRFGVQLLTGMDIGARFNLSLHLDRGTKESRDEYLSRFSPSSSVHLPGVLGYFKTDLSPQLSRLMIEPSFHTHSAIFLSFSIDLPSSPEWPDLIERAIAEFERAADAYGVEINLKA